jgi:hypothetical protein
VADDMNAVTTTVDVAYHLLILLIGLGVER